MLNYTIGHYSRNGGSEGASGHGSTGAIAQEGSSAYTAVPTYAWLKSRSNPWYPANARLRKGAEPVVRGFPGNRRVSNGPGVAPYWCTVEKTSARGAEVSCRTPNMCNVSCPRIFYLNWGGKRDPRMPFKCLSTVEFQLHQHWPQNSPWSFRGPAKFWTRPLGSPGLLIHIFILSSHFTRIVHGLHYTRDPLVTCPFENLKSDPRLGWWQSVSGTCQPFISEQHFANFGNTIPCDYLPNQLYDCGCANICTFIRSEAVYEWKAKGRNLYLAVTWNWHRSTNLRLYFWPPDRRFRHKGIYNAHC